jgi:hypothetical protein
LEKIFRPNQSRNTLIWGLVLLAIVDIPLLLFFFLGSKGPTFFYVIIGVIILVIDGLILSLSFLGKKMSYKLGDDDFIVDFGFSKRRIPYSSITKVKLSHTILLFRLFGASWPGLHWGLYRAKDIGSVWVYSTKMRGDFILLDLMNGKKLAISPEDPESFLNEIHTQKSKFGTSSTSEIEKFETSKRAVYIQVMVVASVFLFFLGYLLWIYPSLPEIIPMHFDFNWNPDRWAHKSELFVIAGVAAIFAVINTVIALKLGSYGKALLILLGVVFILVITLFFGIVYFTQSLI